MHGDLQLLFRERLRRSPFRWPCSHSMLLPVSVHPRLRESRGNGLPRSGRPPPRGRICYIPGMPPIIRTQQEANTSLDGAAVLAAATEFFATRNGIYAAFPEKSGPTYVALRGQGGEDVIFGVAAIPGGTRVTGSSYMFDQQIARFLSALPVYDAPPPAPALAATIGDATSGAPAA